ncbi:MAG: MoxR family ATPase [Candidatus Riflebacteria bacterium]|nr:MoxR family ATPase [Candidatus Riflebacteria bacterium]
MKESFIVPLGVYGFNEVETVILAALVTEDPLLLIGNSGTGKTFLLNSLSEALGLEHRHYNASLISFDDLVGFPYPDQDKGGVKFLETPATVWSAESVLIDEISRCKPEHQNRLFSLVHERRIQGIALSRLRYRWAAMNPCSSDQGAIEEYAGSEPLDPALADRFALLVRAKDWEGLTADERSRVADPGGEGKASDDGGRLKGLIAQWRQIFLDQLNQCPTFILDYTTSVISNLNAAGIRISPRRSRLLTRSLLAASIVGGSNSEEGFRQVLDCSLPHIAWGVEPAEKKVLASHIAAWNIASHAREAWIHAFMAEATLVGKLRELLDGCNSPDLGSMAIAQFLASGPRDQTAALSFALYPAAAMGKLPIGSDGVNDLAKTASPIFTVEGEISWQERMSGNNTQHPDFARYAKLLAELSGPRVHRARQLFNWYLVNNVVPADPGKLEADINDCVNLLKERKLV